MVFFDDEAKHGGQQLVILGVAAKFASCFIGDGRIILELVGLNWLLQTGKHIHAYFEVFHVGLAASL